MSDKKERPYALSSIMPSDMGLLKSSYFMTLLKTRLWLGHAKWRTLKEYVLSEDMTLPETRLWLGHAKRR